jgi:sensor histidine kinase YesM
MTNLRLNRDTKASAFFRNEIDKFVRKSRVKKKNKDKIFAFRDSSMRDSRSLRDFVSESESQFKSSSQFEFVVDSFTVASVAFVAFVVSIAFVASIASVSIDNATLLKMFLQLFFFSSETTSSSIDFVATFVATSVATFVATFVTNSFSIDSITTFVASVIVSIVILEMIEVVDDSNMNDIDVLLKKYDRAQTKLL